MSFRSFAKNSLAIQRNTIEAIDKKLRLYNQLDANVIAINNINGNPFIRELNTFVLYLRNTTINNAIDISRI